MAHTKTIGTFATMAAACAFAAMPASAAELPSIPTPASSFAADPVFETFSPESEIAEHHRFRRSRGFRRRRGVSAGDVIAGVLVLGGIAAIASAASNDRNERRVRDRDGDNRDTDRNRRGDSRFNSGSGIDNAVSQCVSEIENDVRVDSVDSVDRTGEGWLVTGAIFNGDRFACRIGNNGQIETIDYGEGGFSGASADGADDGQWSDDRYAAARQARGSGERASQGTPAYPGGPLPGEEQVDAEFGG
ncbi:MAG: hypothetical protein ABJP48_00400 [Erythrobacter sp.]